MIDREKKYKEELDLCRKNIQRTKRLIEYHKNILRSLESKEKVLSDKLEKKKISKLLSDGQVTLRNCISSKGKKYSAVFSLNDDGKFVNLRFERFAN